jgi:hypothetical protein
MNPVVQNKARDKFWRYLVNFWTVVVYAAVICDFIKNNARENLLAPVVIIYVAVLAIYAGAKEFERWYEFHEGRHPGELFVIAWTILITGLWILGSIFSKPYKIPGEVVSAYISVLGILAVTRKSKSLFKRKVLKSGN